jgi:hypothetical protein
MHGRSDEWELGQCSGATARVRGDPGKVSTLRERQVSIRVEYPDFFVAEAPPANSDGQSWTWGKRAKMSAWGMNNFGTSSSQVCASRRTAAL